MYTIFAILIIICCILLVLVVLVQNPKGGGLSSTFGGGASQMMGVKKTTAFLEKATWTLAISLIVLILIINTIFNNLYYDFLFISLGLFLVGFIDDIKYSINTTYLKTYIWNPNGEDFFISDFTIRHRKGNPVVYGLNENID